MPPPAPAPKRAFFLTPEVPALGQGGGALRSESLLQFLRSKYTVDVVTFEVSHHSKSTPARITRNAVRLLRGRPPLFDRFSGYEDQISKSIPARHYDLAIIEHFWCASYAPLLRPLCDKLVLDLHNIESQLAESHAQALHGPEKWASQRFAAMYRDLEQEWLPRFDTLLVTSEADRQRIHHPNITVFPNALPDMPIPHAIESNAIVFSGNMEYHPNIEAVRWFAQEIWPQVHQRLPEATWRLVGRNPEAIQHIVASLPAVEVIGPVPDAIAALAEAKLCIVPLLSGSGTRFKILEAWAAQRPVISTTIGAEGLGAAPNQHLAIADTASTFIDAIVALWNNPQTREHLATSGRALYQQNFTWQAAWKNLASL